MSIIKDTFFGGAEKKAGQAQERRAEQGIAEQRRQFDVTQEQLAPFREAGVGALEQQQALLGLSGQEEQQTALDAFAESPGQRFIRGRQERSLLRNQAAIGGLGGGNVRTALQEQAAGIASTQLGEQLRQLGGLSGTGQQTAVATGQLGAQTAGNIASLLGTAGAAKASGILGRKEALSSAGGQIAQLAGGFSDARLKVNIHKIGELDSGLGWYEWDWTDDALPVVGSQIAEGVIAQEAQEIFPNAVTVKQGFLHVDYSEIH